MTTTTKNEEKKQNDTYENMGEHDSMAEHKTPGSWS